MNPVVSASEARLRRHAARIRSSSFGATSPASIAANSARASSTPSALPSRAATLISDAWSCATGSRVRVAALHGPQILAWLQSFSQIVISWTDSLPGSVR